MELTCETSATAAPVPADWERVGGWESWDNVLGENDDELLLVRLCSGRESAGIIYMSVQYVGKIMS